MYQFYAIVISLCIAYLATWIHLIAIKHSSNIRSIPVLTLIIWVAHKFEIQVYTWSYSLLSLLAVLAVWLIPVASVYVTDDSSTTNSEIFM